MGSVRKASAWLGLVDDNDDERYYDDDYSEGTESGDAWVTGELFRDGVPVIMNLTNMEPGDAKRVVDFAAGLIFGLRGSIDRVSNRVFLLTPADTEIISGEASAHRSDGFFNQS
jgi:cell division inhibitor SepF